MRNKWNKTIGSVILILGFVLCMLFTGCGGTRRETATDPVNISTAPTAAAETRATPAPTPTVRATAETSTGSHDHETQTPSALPTISVDSTFEIYYLDVGQGDAACVLCDGHAMLIDGGSSSRSDFIYSFLRSHQITHLDCMVASHPDSDHIGGLAGALNYATVGTFYCTVTEDDTKEFDNVRKYLHRQNTVITVPEAGEQFFLGCASVTILYPGPGELIGENTSLVLRICYGDTSFLFMGDCEAEDEASMLSDRLPLQCSVLKIAHHGSNDSTSQLFLGYVDPDYAVISVGGDNVYGHPTAEVLERLKGSGVELYRTDIHGTVRCISDGTSVRFETEKSDLFDPYLAAGGYQNYMEEQERVARSTPDANEEQPDYIANTNTKKFHVPSCSSVDEMKESNKWYFYGTREELIEQGYVPCKRCNP